MIPCWLTDCLHIPHTLLPHHNIREIEEIYPHRHMRELLDMLSELVDELVVFLELVDDYEIVGQGDYCC